MKRKAEDGEEGDGGNLPVPPPVKKRAKKGDAPNLGKILKFSKEEALKEDVAEFFARHAELESEFVELLMQRMDQLDDVKKEIEKLKSAMWNAFPYAKYGSNRDSYAYKRVGPKLSSLRQAVAKHGQMMVTTKKFPLLLEYAHYVLEEVWNNLPEWDDESRNKSSAALLKKISGWYAQAVRGMTQEEFDKSGKAIMDESKEEISDWSDDLTKGLCAALKKKKYQLL
mmetsp:Transcript_12299/g.34679  ORF Transcript_12299/g.34679 Transcript_12299/m.34679 type:complete len:226 (+) Transcript_12299:92-769(+)